eukprot:TRINITY_DN71814_c0_g1_i1.p1 TRINITY_DN71814_c0_g1~~TRINITY_DN71814_c0_g1_i1.p1  ORF type:complete len:845 (-),score=200.41 TRINITY_DN71814_c0_g1_i1:134-2605(-)
MASHGSFAPGGGADADQDRLLDEASSVVKEQAYFMKRAIDNDNLREALKHSSNLICELRTSLLSPRNYYELYMQVFQEMQHLANFFGDKQRHGRKMIELYESVQHAGSILPRMYLLATVGAGYIKSKETSAREILKDMNELTKGVQHPMRGLFLRYYLSQMVKDKLPDTGSEYEGDGGDINDAFEFIFTNFCESNRLWVRMQNQGAAKEKQKREKERHDLRVLVGSNLVRMSQLEGMTADYYSEVALPKILEHIVTVKDTMSQQYLFESMIQVFPDEFHIRTLEKVLDCYRKANPAVDMKPILVALMNRLASYLTNAEGSTPIAAVDIFSLIRTHLDDILDRAMDPSAPDIAAPLEVQAAFMQFTISLYPDRIQYVDIILGSTAQIVVKYFSRTNSTTNKLGGPGAEKVVDLLSCPLKTFSLNVLQMENYQSLFSYLNFQTRKQVAIAMLGIVLEENRPLSSVEAVNHLFGFIAPLIRDEEDTPPGEAKNNREEFMADQHRVCKLVHQVRADDIDLEYSILVAIRGFFGQGGPQRLMFTLPPVYYACLGLLGKLQNYERRVAQEGEAAGPPPQLTIKKAFQFLHKTNSALVSASAESALRLWLVAASAADQVDRACGQPGTYEPFCYEFLTQALLTFEEEITDTARQYEGILLLVGTLSRLTCLDAENMDTVSAKITKHGAKLLKKPMQCRAVAACSHLFWCQTRRDGKRVLECLQKCLKICEAVVTSDATCVGLWVEMLDKYVYYFEVGCEEVNCNFVQSLMNLCLEHITFAESDPMAQADARKAKAHLRSSVEYLRHQKASEDPEVAAKFAPLSFDEVRNM